jgi:uncharacterized membrane protein
MVMRISHPKDFLTGAMFILSGGTAMAMSAGLTIGSAAKMGPGYFPFALGAFLAVLGAILLLRSLIAARKAQAWPVLHLKPLAIVLLSVVLFSQGLRPLGLVASTVGLVVLASTASHEFRWKEAFLNAVVLVVVVLTVFVYFLEFQIPVWPQLVSGRM